jgi:hypothetical protein
LKIRTMETCSSASSIHRIFWWYFKVLSLSRFGQFWAEFAALTVADSMPKLGLKS